MTLAISTGKVDITPGPGGIMAGFGVDVPRISTGTRKPLYARCSILWDFGFPNVIVTADVLGFGHTLHQTIRDRVVALGVGASDFVLSASHTHNGIALPEKLNPFIAYGATASQQTAIQTYANGFADIIVQLVQNTLSAPQTTVTLDYKVSTQTFSYNREGLSYVERDVPILVARSSTGQAKAVWFSYGAHPVAAGLNTQWDPDYPGVAATTIETATGGLAQFILGPAGDQNPDGAFSWALADQLGGQLGQAVLTAIGTVGRSVAGPISTDYRTVSLPLDITPTVPNLAAVRNLYTMRQADTTLPGYYRRHAQTMIQQIDSRTYATTVPLPLQVWKLTGSPSLRLAFCGGEVVSGFGVYFRTLYGGSNKLFFSAYANEMPAYIPSDELLRKTASYAGGYDSDFPGIAGGSMTVYACLGHFRGKPTSTSPDGVEQVFINNLRAMLGTP